MFCVLLSCAHQQLSLLQALRRRIDLLSKQKSDTKATLAAAKSSCEGKADENDTLKAQIKVNLPQSTEPPPLFSLTIYDAAESHVFKLCALWFHVGLRRSSLTCYSFTQECTDGVVQTLEGHIHRQAMMTTRLVEEQNSLLGITTPYELEPSSMCSDPASTSMYATYPNAKSDSRPRNLLPPPSRPAKTRDALGCLLPQPNAAGKSGQDAGHRKALAGKDVARRGGPEALQSEINPPLKTWGSTGKRQPSRPRQKA